MARLPSAEDLGIRETRAVSQGADTRGVRAAGRRSTALDLKAVETTAVQKGLKEEGDRIANEELATAEVQFQIGAMAEAEKYKNDPDFDTVEERHAAGMTDQLGKAAANITSRKTRELFMIRGEEGVAKANAVMSDKVTKKKNDREKGYMASAMDLMVKGGMDLEYGDPGEAALGIQLSLDSMVERGVITRVEAESTLRTAQLDMAYGRLKSMDPKQQLAILNDKDATWVDNIPPDVLRTLKDQAEAQEMNNAALRKAFEMSGMEEADGLAALEQEFVNGEIDDEEYEKARLRFMRVKNDQDVQQLAAIDDYMQEGMAEIAYGGTTIKQLESAPGGIEMMKKMTQAQRDNMYAAEDNAMKRAAGEGRKYSDLEAKTQLRELLSKDQYAKARKYWSENSARLNDADWKFYNAATSPTTSKDPKFKPLQTTHQLMSDLLAVHPVDGDQAEVDLWQSLSDQVENYQEVNQKNPETALINQWVRDKHAQIILDKPTEFLWMEFGGEKTLERDMTPEQKRIVKPITNVYQQAGLTGTAAVQQFNAMSAPERAEFTRMRQRNPGMDPVEFLSRWKRGLRQARERATLAEQTAAEQPYVSAQEGMGKMSP